MTYDYGPITESATRLITEYGKEYTFTRTTDGTYNPATGTASTTTETFAKNALVLEYNARDLANGAILRGDRRMLAEAYSFEVGDKVDIASDTYQVVNVSETAPGGDIIVTNLQVRK